MDDAEAGVEISVDLNKQVISRVGEEGSGSDVPFEVEEFRRHCLLNGLDDIGLTLQKSDAIARYEERAAKATPWL